MTSIIMALASKVVKKIFTVTRVHFVV